MYHSGLVENKPVDTLGRCATVDKLELNETKFKELLISFNTRNPTSFDPVVVNGMPIDSVLVPKYLALTSPMI